MLKKINETASYLQSRLASKPKIGIVLGSGLGNVMDMVKVTNTFPYTEIPNFPVSTVEGHGGNLIEGSLCGVDVLVMQGRFHYYEGYSMKEVTFPVRVMKALGVETLILSNAAGGMNPDFEIGDIMLISDHINLMPEHPLRGKNYDELGPRFPDMSSVYDKTLLADAEEIASKLGFKVKKGVYVGTQGPTYETPAEYKYYRIIGGDAIGMSTVPEAIVAAHSGMRVFAMSIITDLGVEGKIVEMTHEEVQRVAAAAQPRMSEILKVLVRDYLK